MSKSQHPHSSLGPNAEDLSQCPVIAEYPDHVLKIKPIYDAKGYEANLLGPEISRQSGLFDRATVFALLKEAPDESIPIIPVPVLYVSFVNGPVTPENKPLGITIDQLIQILLARLRGEMTIQSAIHNDDSDSIKMLLEGRNHLLEALKIFQEHGKKFPLPAINIPANNDTWDAGGYGDVTSPDEKQDAGSYNDPDGVSLKAEGIGFTAPLPSAINSITIGPKPEDQNNVG